MKISEITLDHVATYLKIDEDEELFLLPPLMDAAKEYISDFTGLTNDEISNKEAFYPVFMMLCQDFYDNRNMYSENQQYINKSVESILSMHSINLL